MKNMPSSLHDGHAENLKLVKAEHFIKVALMQKTSSVGEALLESIGLGLLGAAAGGTIGGLMEDDPYYAQDSMRRGALIGGGIGGGIPLAARIIGSLSMSDQQKMLEKIKQFRNSSI